MKKLILPVIFAICFVFFLPQKTYSQTGPECMKIFDKEMKDCTTEYNACSDACMKEGEKPDGTTYFNAGEIYPKCIKANDCHGKSSACSEQALTNYKACGKPGKQSEAKAVKKETPKQEQNFPFIPLFNLGTDTVTVSYFSSSERSPTITTKDEQKAWSFEGEKMRVLDSGKVQYKSAETGEWADLQSELSLPENSMIKGDWLKLRLDIELTEKVPVVLSLSNFQAEVDPDSIDLLIGEVEFKSRGDIREHPAFTVKTDNAKVITKDTHYWVSYDKDKKETLTGVYEGEVEVKSKDGKVVKVKPDGDKPGVVIVSQKLSVTKLSILGVALLTIVSGIIWFVRKKVLMKSYKIKSKR